jgi:hypothetical protein
MESTTNDSKFDPEWYLEVSADIRESGGHK